ncbi:8439_t:CDS:2 [Entrophospora sp. SA101]|nr:8439_t:CDS:2 [Entrophospora sp. SA101]
MLKEILNKKYTLYATSLLEDYQDDDNLSNITWPPPSRKVMLDLLKGLNKDLNDASTTKHNSSPSSPHFDLLVIGGGATGSGVALDAATRGLKVALVERDDFASGTSSRSTKLVHGGVRYLEKAFKELDYGQYKLVKEALHERANFFNPKEYFENSRTKLLIGHTKTVRTVAWNCDGRKLASGSVDKTVRLWEADQEDIKYSVKLLGHEESVDQLCWNPQSPYELATACIHVVKTDGENINISWSWDGNMVAVGDKDDKISFIDNKKNPSTLPSIVNHYFEDNDSRDESNVENGSTVYKIKTKAATNSVAWHPKGYLLAFAGDEESSIDRTYVGLKIFGFNDLNS